MEHERLHGAAVALAASTSSAGNAVSSTITKNDTSASKHVIDAPVTLRALVKFKRVASEVDSTRVLHLSDRDKSLCFIFATPAEEARPKSKKRRRIDHEGAVEAAVAKLSASPPKEVVNAAKDAIQKLSELRDRGEESVLESWALELRDLPLPPTSPPSSRKQTLLLTARFSPGTVLPLQLLLACMPSEPDGILTCSNSALIGNTTLPLSAQSSVAIDFGLATLQLAMSVGAPFAA